MPRINLLPWREEQRQKRKKDFFTAVFGAVLLGGMLTYASKWMVGQWIDNQERRNTILRTEIEALDRQIEEIRGLENQKERLLARMRIIEQLQQSRPIVVHLLDELVETLPEGMYFDNVQQTDNRIEINGQAQSSTRVATLMRNIESSAWLREPQLGGIETVGSDNARSSEFTVFARQVTGDESLEGEENL
jgi:type IV pilus assembly protein PilN